MSKIIKEQEIVDYAVNTTFTKDFGLFQVKATIWSCVSECENECGYDHDITEIELSFILNGKPCNYLGFKELYEKLYGVNIFNQFYADLITEFEKEYFKQTTYKTK
jgi:hypothetical protein